MNKIIHVWQHSGRLSDDAKRRNSLARESWLKAYSTGHWIERRLDDNILTRTADKVIQGETRALPFIKDILKYGIFGVPNDQIICFTNADTIFSLTITEKILQLFSDGAIAIHGHRKDFPRLDYLLSDEDIPKGEHYIGTDIFCFSAGWWRQHANEFPDMVAGSEGFDRILRDMIKKYHGPEIMNAIYHERHESPWERERLTRPSNIWNRNLARKWLKANNLPLEELEFPEPQPQTK